MEPSLSGRGDDGDGEVVSRFNKYIFDTDQQPDRVNNNGAKFLQQIADLFEENIRGVKSDEGQEASKETEDISLLMSELDKIGFTAGSRASRLSKPSRLKLKPAEVCSTPRPSQKLPCLEVSNISSINPEETFYSFLSDQTGEAQITISEEYVIHDRANQISLYESRHTSALGSRRDKTQSLLGFSDETFDVKTRSGVTDTVPAFCDKYPQPLRTSLESTEKITGNWLELNGLEQEMGRKFSSISSSQAELINQLTRESACKSSFNYLLLDPKLTQNLPMKLFLSTEQNLWRTFVSAIFYVGKGSRSRPFQHLYEAVRTIKHKSSKKTSEKIKKIHSIWQDGGGVVIVQIFHNTIAVEAFTREAAMIEALDCENLTNVKPGDYYGDAADWDLTKKMRLGTFLLFKAFRIFLQEGERQIRPVDLKT